MIFIEWVISGKWECYFRNMAVVLPLVEINGKYTRTYRYSWIAWNFDTVFDPFRGKYVNRPKPISPPPYNAYLFTPHRLFCPFSVLFTIIWHFLIASILSLSFTFPLSLSAPFSFYLIRNGIGSYRIPFSLMGRHISKQKSVELAGAQSKKKKLTTYR